MLAFVHSLITDLLHRWEFADSRDFGALALSVVVTAWFVSHYCGDR